MLFAVEGGGFFSSSASGYSKGLALLLLGHKDHDDKPMRVSPWKQYQLVERESDNHLQLASAKTRIARGCASFVCFGRASAGVDSPSPLKVGPTQQQDVLPKTVASEKEEVQTAAAVAVATVPEDNAKKVVLKSSLKKASKKLPVPVEGSKERELASDTNSQTQNNEEKRKVQWTDTCGSELVDIREFEPRNTEDKTRWSVEVFKKYEARAVICWLDKSSENSIEIIVDLNEADGSDDEFNNSNERSCSCVIM